MTDQEPPKSLFEPKVIRQGELEACRELENNFVAFPTDMQTKLQNFPNWVRHRDLARFLFKADIYRSILTVPGMIFECGVLYGGGMSTWLHLNEIYEPVNYGRRVFGFDTFSGFPSVSANDIPKNPKYPEIYQKGTYSAAEAEGQVRDVFDLIDRTRKLPQFPRARVVKGDVTIELPRLLQEDRSITIALLYLDLDLYEPTRACIEACLPRMPKGSVICIDEINFETFPGETQAVYDCLDLRTVTMERVPWVPNIAVIRL